MLTSPVSRHWRECNGLQLVQRFAVDCNILHPGDYVSGWNVALVWHASCSTVSRHDSCDGATSFHFATLVQFARNRAKYQTFLSTSMLTDSVTRCGITS